MTEATVVDKVEVLEVAIKADLNYVKNAVEKARQVQLAESKAILGGVALSVVLTGLLVFVFHVQYITGMGALIFLASYGTIKYFSLREPKEDK